jgi:hypothetical protein
MVGILEHGDNHSSNSKCLENGAGSTGRCNTGLEFTCWSLKV